MKKFLLATVALVALGATVPALAADLGARTLHQGSAGLCADLQLDRLLHRRSHRRRVQRRQQLHRPTNSSNDGRFLGGVQAGADYQFAPNWVVGIEGQYSWLGGNNNGVSFTGAGAGYVYTHDQRGLGSVTGRLGYTWGPALLYVKGGYAYSDYTKSLTLGGVPQAFAIEQQPSRRLHRRRRPGIHVRPELVGARSSISTTTSASTNFVTPAVLTGFGSIRNDEHTFKAGLNYRFNWGGPVVAKY